MNPHLDELQPYPFERLNALKAGVSPASHLAPISLSIGEPRHATPEMIKQAYCQAIMDADGGLSVYPATAGVGQATLRRLIVQAIEDREPELAAERMSAHINDTRRTVESWLRR